MSRPAVLDAAGYDQDGVFWPTTMTVRPCFGCGQVHLDMLDAEGEIGACATIAPAEIERTIASLRNAARQLGRVRDTIGACDAEA